MARRRVCARILNVPEFGKRRSRDPSHRPPHELVLRLARPLRFASLTANHALLLSLLLGINSKVSQLHFFYRDPASYDRICGIVLAQVPRKRARFDIPLSEEDIALNCVLFRGDNFDCLFVLDIKANRNIITLVDRIKVKLGIAFWTPIQLVQVSLSIDEAKQVKPNTITEGVLTQDLRTMADVFGELQYDLVNVIVVAPPTIESPPVPSLYAVGAWREQRQHVQIPALELLNAYLRAPIPEQEKIPIDKPMFARLLAKGLDQRNLLSVFRPVDISDISRSTVFFHAVLKEPPTSGTEDAFHATWDGNIRAIIELCVPGGISQRNTNHHTATGKSRPDYTYCIWETCPFRGEEESPDNPEDPRQELADKLAWMFGSGTPYILGYYARGPLVTFVALTAPQSKVVIHDLIKVNLGIVESRIQNVLHLMNLSALLEPLSHLMASSGPEFLTIERDACTIDLTSFVIIKTYKDSAKAKYLCSVHALIADKKIPNTDRVSYCSDCIVHLKPRGSAGSPRTLRELCECLRCVLQVLVVAHPIGLYHRDIRPENVIRNIEDPSKWFLIDWEDASVLDTWAQPHFARETHSPDVFHDGHGPEVDIWGVGLLITRCPLIAEQQLGMLGQSLQEKAREFSAAEVLQQVDAIYDNLPAL